MQRELKWPIAESAKMKAKSTIGAILATILLLVGGLVLFHEVWLFKAGKPSWVMTHGGDLSGWLIILSIALGIALSVGLTGLAIRKLLASNFGMRSDTRNGGKIGAYLGGLVSAPYALFLGFVAGGNLGGGWGSVVLGKTGAILGIGLGLFVVTVIISLCAALAGFLLGSFAEIAAKRFRV